MGHIKRNKESDKETTSLFNFLKKFNSSISIEDKNEVVLINNLLLEKLYNSLDKLSYSVTEPKTKHAMTTML